MDLAPFSFPAVDLSIYTSNYTGKCIISFYEPDKDFKDSTMFIVDVERPFEVNIYAEKGAEVNIPPSDEVFLLDLEEDGLHRVVCGDNMKSLLFIDIGYIMEIRPDIELKMTSLSKEAQRLSSRAIPCTVIDILDEDGNQIKDCEDLFDEEISFTIVAIESEKLNVILRKARTSPEYHSSRNTEFTKEELKELFEEPEMVTTNALKAVGGYIPKDVSENCPFYDSKTGACFKGNSCRLKHVPTLMDGTTRDRKVMYKLNAGFVPMIGSTVKVCITCIVCCDEFFVQIPEIAALSPSGSLEQLKRKINAPDMVEKYKQFVGIPDLHDLVLILNKKIFYRARVIDVTNCGCIVFFLDYGFTVNVTVKDIYQWDPRWSIESAQAHRCFLENARQIKSKEEEGIEAFHSLIQNLADISAKIIWCADDLYVRLYDDRGFDIGEIFCAEGIAECQSRIVPTYQFIPG